MDLKVEHLENHTAQIIVKVDDEQLEQARRTTAKRLAKDLRIPGFRPGKAPYDVILNYVGLPALTYETVDDIGNDIYKQALEESGIEPYSAGEITDVNTDDGLTLTFRVTKYPTIDLGNYRETLRLDYEVEEVKEEDVENSLARTRENLALTETVDRPAQMGDEVVMNIHGVFRKPEKTEETSETESESQTEEEVFIDQRQMDYMLLDDPKRDLVSGFSPALVGALVDEEREFSLTFPEDEEDQTLAGRTVDFKVTVTEVRAVIMPEMDDFMAELASDGEQKDLASLRDRLRQQLVELMESRADEAYSEKVLTQLAEAAQITYPDVAVEDYIDDIIHEMDDYMRQQAKVTLDDFVRLSNSTKEQLREQQRERAIERMRRSLVLAAVAREENLTVESADVNARVDEVVRQFSGGQDQYFYDYLRKEGYYERTAANLLSERVMKQLTDIAKGKNPPRGSASIEGDESTLTEVATEDNSTSVAE